VTERFRQHYLDRAASGKVAERPGSALQNPEECSLDDVRGIVTRGPFFRFSRLGYVNYARDRAYYQIARPIWNTLSSDETARQQIETLCEKSIRSYYNRSAKIKDGDSA
jgi:hypothetical protein